MLYQIAYISIATEPMDLAGLNVLLKQSRKNNREHDLTGFLLYENSYFMQVLEGPEEALKHTYASILQDERHGSVVQILGHPIEERDFPDWLMGFIMEDNIDSAGEHRSPPFLEEDHDPEPFSGDRSASRQLLLDFRRAH